jgi:hypothetical protein
LFDTASISKQILEHQVDLRVSQLSGLAFGPISLFRDE